MSWLYVPSNLDDAATFVAAPIRVTLANRANRQGAYDPRRATDALLSPPAVVGGAVAFPGPGTRLVSPRDRVPLAMARLSPPAVVLEPPPDLIAGGPGVRLAPQPLQPRRPQWRLGVPEVVYVLPLNFGPGVRLAPQPTQPRRAHPRLSPPAVVEPFVAVLARPIKVTLVRIRPFPTDASVFKPAVVSGAQGPQGGIGIQLAPSFRGEPKSKLNPPTVVTAAAIHFGPVVNLAYSKRGKPLSGLGRPVVVDPNPVYPQGPMVQYVASPRQARAAHWKLRAPVVLGAQGAFYGPSVTLAPQSRGKAKSQLSEPAVIGGGIAFSGPRIRLTNPLDRVPPTFSRLPQVVYEARVYEPIQGHLTPPRDRVPATMSRLAPPSVLTAAAIFSGPLVTLAPSRRPVAKSRLLPVPAAFRPVGQLSITLAPSSRGRAKSILREPVVVHGAITLSGPRVRRASRRTTLPVAKYRLGPPVVVTAAETFTGPKVTLAPSRRGQPKSLLRPPVDTVGLEDQGRVAVHLARIRPVRTLAFLGEPVVVHTAVELSGPETWLAYSRRGRPMSRLLPPLFGAPVPKAETVISVTLAYSLRGKAKPRLPQVVYGAKVYAPISVTLAPSRFPTPKSQLLPPAVVAQPETIIGVKPVLVRIRPPRTRYFLKPPTVVLTAVELSGPAIHLTYSKRGRPLSFLSKPVVVMANRGSMEGPLVQYVASPRQARRAHWKLGAPTIIGAQAAFFGPEVTLVRIRPPKTMWKLRLPVVVGEECYGAAVCGFDFAAEVCGTDTAATVTGELAAGQAVSGSDSAATIEGATAPGGSVTGGDERREGC